jgi:hypothetical protein
MIPQQFSLYSVAHDTIPTTSSMNPKKLLPPFLLAVSFLVGCYTPVPTTYGPPKFDTSKVDEVTILSVIDARDDKSKAFQFDKMLPKPTADKLKEKGYKARVVLDPSLVSGITQDAVAKADPDWIKSLGPSDSHWIFVWSVREVSHRVAAVETPFSTPTTGLLNWGPKGKSGMSAILFDKTTGTIAWQDEKVMETRAGGGLLGMALAGLVDNDAIEAGFQSITRSFPAKSSR